jgi:hypothetical protein
LVKVISSVSRYALIRRNTYLPTGNVKSPGSETTDHPASNKESTMASRGKKKTTFAKLNRETKLRERRAEKEARKQARKLGLADAAEVTETLPGDADETISGETDETISGETDETLSGDAVETVSAGSIATAPAER